MELEMAKKFVPRRTVITEISKEHKNQCTVYVAYTRRTIDQVVEQMPFLQVAADLLRAKAATLKKRWRAKVLEEWAAALDGSHEAVQKHYFWRFDYIQWALSTQNWNVYEIDARLRAKLYKCRTQFEAALEAMGVKVFQESVCTCIDHGKVWAQRYRTQLTAPQG